MNTELFFAAGAVLVAFLILLFSPLSRAICWDAFVHPFDRCKWEKCDGRVRELKGGPDHTAEG